ncbi:MAG: hypothetical protein Tsb009_09840 [Planctomycetaceae bacterium]
MHEFVRQLSNSLSDQQRDAGILVAVSGGADSVALLRAFKEWEAEHDFPLAAAHCHHGLRSIEADEDAAWLKSLCERLSIPLLIGHRPVTERAASERNTLEEAARKARYEFLVEAAQHFQMRSVAVAHTFDDQAETILHHILRGSGLSGLRGIPKRRRLTSPEGGDIDLIRPFLSMSRLQVEKYLLEIGQEYRIDSTNDELRFTRNRIRHQLLPMLRDEYNPAISEALVRLGEQAAELESVVSAMASRLLDEALEDCTESICRLNCDVLTQQPIALVRVCLIELWKRNRWPRKNMGSAQWNRLADIVFHGGTLTLPGGFDVRKRGRLLVVTRKYVPDLKT